jgi:hypothetical protein
VSAPKAHADFRPISITPVLTRVMERTVVRRFIYPALLSPPPSLSFSDQFAFRPTGSPTAAAPAPAGRPGGGGPGPQPRARQLKNFNPRFFVNRILNNANTMWNASMYREACTKQEMLINQSQIHKIF